VVNYLINTKKLSRDTLKKLGLLYFDSGENQDYLCDDFVMVSSVELERLKKASSDMVALAHKAIIHIVENDRLKELGIPKNARKLVKYSVLNEMGQQLVSRLDFAGGFDGIQLKLLEFNADTCTLLPETAFVQREHYNQEKRQLFGPPHDGLMNGLVEQFEHILAANPSMPKSLLISTMGHAEDWLSSDVVEKAAKKAGFEVVQSMLLERVIFSADEGIFIEIHEEHFEQYHFWFKIVPWEFIADDEPDLMDLLEPIIMKKLAVVINPAYTMLLQSKAIIQVMKELEPNNPLLLTTSFEANQVSAERYVCKPVFGRLGENITYHDKAEGISYNTDGDYGGYKMVYQEIADFNIDKNEYRYQPSMFWTGKPCALGIRRQDDPIIDDDAQFVSHTVID
jgi:glutathionylspermidine synthase